MSTLVPPYERSFEQQVRLRFGTPVNFWVAPDEASFTVNIRGCMKFNNEEIMAGLSVSHYDLANESWGDFRRENPVLKRAKERIIEEFQRKEEELVAYTYQAYQEVPYSSTYATAAGTSTSLTSSDLRQWISALTHTPIGTNSEPWYRINSVSTSATTTLTAMDTASYEYMSNYTAQIDQMARYGAWQNFEARRESPEERAVREIREKEITIMRRAAKERSLELLLRNLSKEQLKRFNEDKCIPVDGPSGEKYLIKPARSINIEVVGKTHRLCAGIDDNSIPIFDAMLAQKLMLEADEERFLRIANVHS